MLIASDQYNYDNENEKKLHSYLLFIHFTRLSEGQHVKHIVATILQQVKDEFKTLRTFVVRIRHTVTLWETPNKVNHPHHFTLIFQRRCKSAKTVIITMIHSHYKIEIVIVGGTYRTTVMSEIIASLKGMDTHTAVGQFSGMSAI